MTALDVVQSVLALFVCGMAFATAVTAWANDERRVAMYCWYAHALSAFAIVSIYRYYYRGGDLVYYFRQGQFLARYVEYDVAANLPDLLKLLFQREVTLPITFHGAGSSTGSMVAVGGLVGLATSSLWAASVVVSSMTALGQVLLWKGLRGVVPAERRTTALWATFMVPSVIFWSSSLLKEAFALMGLGLILWGLSRLKTANMVTGASGVLAGSVVVGLFKAYILFPLVVAVAVYWYWSRAASRGGVRMRPVPLLIGSAASVGLMLALGELFPNYSLDSVADSIEQQQMSSLTTAGGSDFRSPDPVPQRGGVLGLLAQSPLTLFTALLRPMIVEVRNPLMLVNSLETSAALYIILSTYSRADRPSLIRWMWRSPDIMASVAFVILFALAVGLATTNLGTLSRYRLPMMPFYLYVISTAYMVSRRRDPDARVNAVAFEQSRVGHAGR